MKFFDSTHCSSGSHCKKCRDKDGGRKFRKSLRVVFEDIDTDDFECPAGKEWATFEKRVEKSHFLSLYNEIMTDETNVHLLSMANQCKEMYYNVPKGITCKSRKEFRNRWYQKLKYYRKELKHEKTTA